jgi:hypothetical protein
VFVGSCRWRVRHESMVTSSSRLRPDEYASAGVCLQSGHKAAISPRDAG